jgi:hypothetical protein
MHSLIHQDLARELGAVRARPSGPAVRPPKPEPPPRPVRAGLAHALAAVAGRVDRDAARRAVA